MDVKPVEAVRFRVAVGLIGAVTAALAISLAVSYLRPEEAGMQGAVLLQAATPSILSVFLLIVIAYWVLHHR